MNLEQRLSWKAIPRRPLEGGEVVFCNMRCTRGLRNERGGSKTRDVGKPRQHTETVRLRTNGEGGGKNAAGRKSLMDDRKAGHRSHLDEPKRNGLRSTDVFMRGAYEICTQTHLFTCLHDQENGVGSFLEEKRATGSVTADVSAAAAG